MAAPHLGHIICLYAGRAVYCPKAANLEATLKASLECLGLDTNKEVHFGFPHADLAILVEISALAFKNVRDGAILYLCDGPIGPVYPHELAFQAHQGQAAAARRPPGRAITPAPAPAAAAAAAPLPANAPNAAPARAGRANATTNTNARVTRASQRLRNQTNATEAGNLNQVGADKELSQGRSSVASVNAEGSAGPSSSSASATARVKREMTEEEDDHDERDDYESMQSAGSYSKRRRVAH